MGHVHGLIMNPTLRQILKAESTRQITFEALAPDANYFLEDTNPATGGTSIAIATDGWTKAWCPEWPVVPTFLYTEVTGSEIGRAHV